MQAIEIIPKLIPNPPKGFFAFIIWALLKNEDDGEIGDLNWNPQQRDTVWVRIKWWFRNPAHNLCFYVIGYAGKRGARYGDYPDTVFNPNGGWNRCIHVTEDGKSKFVSYIGWCKFYWGPRERGNFGIKFTLNSKRGRA